MMVKRKMREGGALREGYEEAKRGMFMAGGCLKGYVAVRYGSGLVGRRRLDAAMADLRAGFRGEGEDEEEENVGQEEYEDLGTVVETLEELGRQARRLGVLWHGGPGR